MDHAPPLVHVRISGPLAVRTAPDLRRVVLKALTDEPAAILIDLREVTEVDPIATTVFPTLANAAAAWPGTGVVLHSARPSLARLLDELAVCRQVPLAVDRAAAEALAAATRGPVNVRWRIYDSIDGLSSSRRIVQEFCRRQRITALSDSAELVITELATNAVLYGAAPFTLTASSRQRYLHLSVRDCGAGTPRRRDPDGDAREGGRGLMIVEALTVAWGTTVTADGKVVWATFRPPAPPPREG